jgi:hypothetical protein
MAKKKEPAEVRRYREAQEAKQKRTGRIRRYSSG